MFFVLSALAEKVYNKNWNELVAEKFFRPLEMKNSYGSSAVLKKNDSLSLTYAYRDSFRLEETKQMDDLLAGGARSFHFHRPGSLVTNVDQWRNI